jgi:hypothetical protein
VIRIETDNNRLAWAMYGEMLRLMREAEAYMIDKNHHAAFPCVQRAIEAADNLLLLVPDEPAQEENPGERVRMDAYARMELEFIVLNHRRARL